jgi:hypothetical protein
LPEGRKNHGQRKAPGMGQGSHKKFVLPIAKAV